MISKVSPVNGVFHKGDRVYCYQSEFKNFGKFKVMFIKKTENGRRIFYCKRIEKKGKADYIEAFFSEDMCYYRDLPKEKENRFVKISRFD